MPEAKAGPKRVVLRAPTGHTRVVLVNLTSTEYSAVLGDYESRELALALAEDHNLKRQDRLAPVCYVYDDEARCLNSESAAKSIMGRAA